MDDITHLHESTPSRKPQPFWAFLRSHLGQGLFWLSLPVGAALLAGLLASPASPARTKATSQPPVPASGRRLLYLHSDPATGERRVVQRVAGSLAELAAGAETTLATGDLANALSGLCEIAGLSVSPSGSWLAVICFGWLFEPM